MFSTLLVVLAMSKEIAPGANLSVEIAQLQPGETLTLQGGMYATPTGQLLISVSGTAAMPITIRSKPGERAHIRRASANQNITDISGRYLVFRDLEFSGGSRGLRFLSNASFITVEGCEVHGTDDVAIAANDSGGTYDGFRFLRNNVHDTSGTGEAMYFGCNNATCRFANAIIEGNWLHDTNAASVVQGDGLELKEGSYGNIVRDNVIHDTNYPCITLYSTSSMATMPNVIERNAMWRCGDHGIQVSRDAVIRNNIILSAASDGISVMTHAQVDAGSGNVQIVNNTVLDADGAAIAVRGAISPVLVANNAAYVMTGQALLNNSGAQVTSVGNVLSGSLAADFVGASFSGTVPNNVFPKLGGALVDAGQVSSLPADDFNGTARGVPATVGAYQFAAAGNPGWALDAGFKGAGGTGGGAAGGGAGGGSAGGGSAGGGSAGGGSAGGGSAGGGSAGGGSAGSGGTGGSGTGGGAEMTGGCGCSSSGELFAVLSLLAFAGRPSSVRRRAR